MSKKLEINKIEIEGLSFEYSSVEPLLKDVSLEFPAGKVIWLTGPHGTGKSAFIKLLCGLVNPLQGHIKFNDLNVDQLSFEELQGYRLNIGYSFDHGGLLNNKSLAQNLSLPLEYHNYLSKFDIASRVLEYVDMFGLKDKKDERPAQVTGGLRKAACVARAFVNEPELLLLDDPTTGLRSFYKKVLAEKIVSQLESGVTKFAFVATEDKEFLACFNELLPCRVENCKMQFTDVVPGEFWRKGVAS